MNQILDDKVMSVWQWCYEAYLQHGMRITFPKHTDPRRTYQWRFASSIAKKFSEWKFDDDTAKKFVTIAVGESKRRGVLKKGLAALHQSNMLDICYQIVTSQQIDDIDRLNSLKSMKKWFDGQIGSGDPLTILLYRKERTALSNVVMWYQASKLSDLFLALSRTCCRAIAKLQDNSIENRLLPTTTSLYLLRSEFLSECNNKEITRNLFGKDWRNS